MTEYSYRKRSMERKLRKKRRLTVIGIARGCITCYCSSSYFNCKSVC